MAAGCHCRPLWFNLFLAAANYKFFAKFRPHELLSDMLPGMDLENTVQMNRSPDPVNDQNEEAANKQALDYLRTIGRIYGNGAKFRELKNYFKNVQQKSLKKEWTTPSSQEKEGMEIGELTISVEETTRGGEICYLVHAHSHGTLDGVPCGTSVTAYVARGFVTLEQTQHEYVKIPKNPLDKKTILVKQGGQYYVKSISTEGQNVQETEKMYTLLEMEGFISEGSNVILQRIMAIRKDIPDDATFLALDTQLSLCSSSYHLSEARQRTIEDQAVEVTGIQRDVYSMDGSNTTWRTYFLQDGHMCGRTRLGSPVTMQLLRLPRPEDEEERTVPPRHKDLRWEEDMQLHSHFLDRKQELASDHSTYVRRHPELRALMADFVQFLLLRKPDDVCAFASDYFAAFSSRTKTPCVTKPIIR